MSYYPDKISRRFDAPTNIGKPEKTNSVGTGAAFVCGSFVRFYLEIEANTKEIREAKFNSNGCGFAIAAADVLAAKLAGHKLTELRGLENLRAEIEIELDKFPDHRAHCLEICVDALNRAFADFRASQIEEFAGEKAMICTCFGVSEETIEGVIKENQAETIEEIGAICNAGTGCGSCQFLIRELIDVYQAERL